MAETPEDATVAAPAPSRLAADQPAQNAAAAPLTEAASPPAEAPAADEASAAQAEAAAEDADGDEDVVDMEELLVHIKGIKFQNPDFGAGRITKQVQKLGGAFAKVNEKRVKRLMKKNGLTQAQLDEDARAAGILRLHTVGDASKPHRPAAAPNVAAASQTDWALVELSVPFDRSGQKNHQAVISHSNVADSLSKLSAAKPELGTIYKIQATADDGLPLLLYNQTKSQSTFIHPETPGYLDIQRQIRENGVTGATTAEPASGSQPGLKAYFYCKQTRETGRKFLLVHTKELAPHQAW